MHLYLSTHTIRSFNKWIFGPLTISCLVPVAAERDKTAIKVMSTLSSLCHGETGMLERRGDEAAAFLLHGAHSPMSALPGGFRNTVCPSP